MFALPFSEARSIIYPHGTYAMRFSIVAAIACSTLAFLASGCTHESADANRQKKTVVHYVMPVEQEVTDYEDFTGRTDAVESVDVRARVTGYLTEINYKAGDEVKKGEVLFKIDPRPYQAVLDQADGELAIAEAQLKLATADLARATNLAQTKGAISQQDVDRFAAAEAQGRAQVQAAKAHVETAKLNLEFTSVTAPIDGLASRHLVTVGNLISQDNTLLTTIVSLDPIYAYFDVDERTMLRVQQMIRDGKFKGVRDGGSVPVQFGLANEEDKFPHDGVLDFVNNRVDPATGTLEVRGVINNPSQNKAPRLLTPGLFLRVRLPIGGAHKSLLLPQAAVGADQGRKYVLVVNDQNVVEYRPIAVGAIQPSGLQVVVPLKIVRTEGKIRLASEGEQGEDSLSVKDRVIVGGLQRVRPGIVVEAKPADAT